MKKRFISILIIMVLVVSSIAVSTSFAASISISGESNVYPGETYNYNISVSDYACAILARVNCSGFASASSTIRSESDDIPDENGGLNENISGSTTISITVPADAAVGQTCTISVEAEVSYFDGTSDTDAYPSQSKTVTVVARPAAPAATPKPSKKPSSSTNNVESAPTATPEPLNWDLAAMGLEAMSTGGSLSVDITGEDSDTAIPASVYQSLREKQGTLTLNFGTYSCTLDGAALGALGEDVESLELGLSFETDPDFSAAVGGADVYQLHFAHSGNFPGKISYTFKAESSSPGDEVYLYYYYGASGVIEGIQSAIVDEDGYVTFDIYHCSDYFVSASLVEGAAGIVVSAPEPSPTPAPTPSPTPAPTEEPAAAVTAAPASSFSFIVLIAVGAAAALIAVLATMFVCKAGLFKKKYKH